MRPSAKRLVVAGVTAGSVLMTPASASAVDCASVPLPARPACLAAGVAGDVIAGAGSKVAAGATQSLLSGLVGTVVDAAIWLLTEIGERLDSSTQVDVHAKWFASHYQTMAGLGAVFCLLFVLLTAASTVFHRQGWQVYRAVTMTAAAGIGTGMVTILTGLLLKVTDDLSAAVSGGAHEDMSNALAGATKGLAALLPVGLFAPKVPLFAVLIVALLVIAACFVIWLELLLRSAAIYATVLFFPLALAGMTWNATARWAARLARTLVALILSKFVIVAVLNLAASGLASGPEGFSGVLTGVALLLLAAFSPFLLFRVLGIFDDSSGHAALDGLRSRGMWHVIYGGSSALRTVESFRSRRRAPSATTAKAGTTAGAAGSAGGAKAAAATGPAGLIIAGAYTAGRATRNAAGRVVRRFGTETVGDKPIQPESPE